MKITQYLRSLIQENTANSSKSFALVVSVGIGALIGLCICFTIIYDVITNGSIQTDLNDLGIFLLCVGGYVAGGGINKALTENIKDKRELQEEIKKSKEVSKKEEGEEIPYH